MHQTRGLPGLERGETSDELNTRSCEPLALFEIDIAPEADEIDALVLAVVQPETGHVLLGPPPVTCFLREPVIRAGKPMEFLEGPRDEVACWKTGIVVGITRLRKCEFGDEEGE